MAEASKDSGYVDNWQAGKTVTECNLHMLTTEDCSDVIFRVGSQEHVVRAHRYVLVSRSCVFHAMFCGPLAEKGEITVPDIDPDVFREFLRYLYSDTVNITEDNVTGLLYTSRKYAVDALFNKCVTFLEKSLTEENVCQILEQCHGYGELDLQQNALKILTEAGENLITSPGFLDLCPGCLEKFLKSDKLKLMEEAVFEATLSWAKEKCGKESLKDTHENLRKVLGKMLYEVRFVSFSVEYLVKTVGPSGLLTSEERICLVDRSYNSKTDISPFKCSSRKPQEKRNAPIHYVNRFLKPFAGVAGNDCKNAAITFCTNKTIQLLGCQLYGPCKKVDSTYSLNILLYDDQDQVIAEPVPISEWNLRGKKESNFILFSQSINIIAGRYYTILVKIDGVLDFGSGGCKTVEECGVQFTFKKSSKSTYFTNTDKGQIPALIWRVEQQVVKRKYLCKRSKHMCWTC